MTGRTGVLRRARTAGEALRGTRHVLGRRASHGRGVPRDRMRRVAEADRRGLLRGVAAAETRRGARPGGRLLILPRSGPRAGPHNGPQTGPRTGTSMGRCRTSPLLPAGSPARPHRLYRSRIRRACGLAVHRAGLLDAERYQDHPMDRRQDRTLDLAWTSRGPRAIGDIADVARHAPRRFTCVDRERTPPRATQPAPR